MKTLKILSVLFVILVAAVAAVTFNLDPISGMGLVSMAVVPLVGMKSSKILKEERGVKLQELEGILKLAKDEKRELTDDEKTSRSTLNDDMDAMDLEIKEVERTEMRIALSAGKHINKANEEKEKKELREYSFLKTVRGVVSGNLDGFELEMHQEAEKEARAAGVTLEGIGIPNIILANEKEMRDMTASGGSSGSEGGAMIQTDVVGFIDKLQAKLMVSQLGAFMMTNLVGNIDIPKVSANIVGAWEGENDDNAEDELVFTKLALTPKRLGAYTQVSKRLINQVKSPNVEGLVKADLERAVRLAVDLAAINGSGSAGQPTGILNTSGIGSVLGGTNGAAPDWADIVNLESEVAVDNADIGALAYLTNPKVKGKLKQTEVTSNSGLFVWPQNENTLNGYKAASTTQVPSDLDKGTATGVCSAIIFGNFNDLIIGQWAGLDLVVDPYTDAKKSLVNLIINSWWDIGVRNAESFAAMKDALTT